MFLYILLITATELLIIIALLLLVFLYENFHHTEHFKIIHLHDFRY